MDYAKYSYLKLSELQTEMQSDNQNNSASNSVEFTSGVLNTVITSSTDYTCGELFLYGTTYLQCKAIFEASEQGTILLELLVDDLPVLAEERFLDSNETQIILMKSYTPYTNGEATVKLRVKILQENYACKLTNCVLGAWGSVYCANDKSSMQMRALEYSDNLLVSYNQNNNIFVAETKIQEKSFAPSDFTLVASGISHCFATDKNNILYFFRVDASGNLFYSKYGNLLEETKLDSNVSVVFARQCNASMPEDMLICYIKQGRPMFRCMTDSVIGSETAFKVPNGDYIDLEIANAPDAEQMFVICTHQNYSNYILYSVNENDVSVFVESLNASIATVFRNYVNLAFDQPENVFVENLSASLLADINRFLIDYEELLNNKIVENLNADILSSASVYTIEQEPEINYELFYSQIEEFVQGSYRVVYGADCSDWQPATIDVNGTGAIQDSYGILNKWPFNKIKPCLVEDGKLLGYLNPDDYSQFEDGSQADITNEAYDVMVEFPKIYYKIEQDWDNIAVWNTCTKADVKIYISNTYKDGYVCYSHTRQGVEYDSIYISAYENFVNDNDKLVCCSGVTPLSKYSHYNVLTNFSQYKSEQYGTFHYHIATMLQLLSLLLFKEYEGAYTYGVGYQGSNETLFNTGVNNTKGMFYGLFTGGTHCSKLFGLENITGHCNTVLDGLLSTDDHHYLIYDPTNPDCKINYAGENYTEVAPTMSTMLAGYLIRVSADTKHGFLPVSNIPAISYSKPYYNCACHIRKPSQYNSGAAADYKPYMIYNYGGYYNTTNPSLFSIISMYNINDLLNVAERLVCYPTSKMS